MSVPPPPTAADFGGALRELLAAAGLTPDRVLANLGARRHLVSRTSLYDWMKNNHLPDDDGPVLEVVALCLEAAKRRGTPVDPAPTDVQGWRDLLSAAKHAKDGRTAVVIRRPERKHGPMRPGMPIRRWNPIALGVHSAIGGTLPAYVPREHDGLLRGLLDPKVVPSRMVVLRGASSTGKTRAAYEAVRECLPEWLVDYPRTTAMLAKRLREGFVPRTVIWLDELRHFTNPDAQVLAELADMLTVSSQVVVIAMLWPAQWAAYTRETGPVIGRPSEEDEYTRGSRGDSLLGLKPLLRGLPELSHSAGAFDPVFGGIIDVPERFTEPEIASARQQADTAIVTAIAAAEAAGAPGMVTQYLAGVPDLEEHYGGPGSDPYGRAVITAAMDAARFGHARPFPEALLHEAVIGYLDDPLRTVPQARWWAGSLRYATRELKGTVTALTPVPPASGTGVAGYRLTDYLDQRGREVRQAELGPNSLWRALIAHASDSADLSRIGQSAYDRGIYRYAAGAWRKAVAAGGIGAIRNLLSLLRRVAPESCEAAASWVAAHAAVDRPAAAAAAFEALREGRQKAAASVLAARAAETAALDDPDGLVRLLRLLTAAQESAAMRTLVARIAGSATETVRVELALRVRQVFGQGAASVISGFAADVGRPRQVTPAQAAERVTVVNAKAVAKQLRRLQVVQAHRRASAAANRAAERFPLHDPGEVVALLRAFRDGGHREATARLVARRPEAQVALGRADQIAGLLRALRQAGHLEAAAALGQRFATHAPMASPRGLDRVFTTLIEAGEREAAGVLARRAVACRALRPLALNLLHTWDGVFLIGEFYKAGEKEAALALAAQVAEEDGPRRPWRLNGVSDLLAIARRIYMDYGTEVARAITAPLIDDDYVQGPLESPRRVANNIKWLHRADAMPAIDALLARHPADHVTLYDPEGIAQLFGALRRLPGRAAAEAHRALLARRPEEHVSISDAGGLARLLDELVAADAQGAVVTLVQRIFARFEVTDAMGAAALLRALREADTGDLTELAQLAGDQANLSDPLGAALLVKMLARLGIQGIAADVAKRAAEQAVLDDAYYVTRLLDAIAGTGVSQALPVLAGRAANTGFYEPLVDRGLTDDFAFGREPDGTASRPWAWGDL